MGLSWPFNVNAKAATSVTVDANGCVLHPACVREKMLSSKRYFTVPPALRKGLNDSSTAFPFSSPVPFPHRLPPDSTLMSRSSLFDSVASVVCWLFLGVAVEKGCVHVTKRLLSVMTMEGRNKFQKWRQWKGNNIPTYSRCIHFSKCHGAKVERSPRCTKLLPQPWPRILALRLFVCAW